MEKKANNSHELTQEEKVSYFVSLGERLLEHRYRYYGLDSPVIEDYEYDYIERYYESTAMALGLEPTASNMVDFDLKRADAQAAKARVDSCTDHYSLWLAEMKPVWEQLGPPAKAHKSASTPVPNKSLE